MELKLCNTHYFSGNKLRKKKNLFGLAGFNSILAPVKCFSGHAAQYSYNHEFLHGPGFVKEFTKASMEPELEYCSLLH